MCPIPIDVHLMVEPVDALIPLFAKAGANLITFHPEASAPCGPHALD
jgi:ribulose-phosphate 3-epimerase